MLPEDLSELLSAYLDGEISARQRTTVTRLLDESEEARLLLGKLEGDAVALRHLSIQKPTIDLSGAILGAIAAEAPRRLRISVPQTRPAARPLPVWKRYTAAAAVLVGVGIGTWLALGGAGQGGSEVAVQPPTNRTAETPKPVEVAEADPVIGPEVPHRPGSDSVFAFPSTKATELHPARVRLPLVQMMRELEAPVLLEQLQEKTRDSACHIDLYCADPARAVERLGAACMGRQIRINFDPAAADRLESQPHSSFAVYVENVKPAEIADILRELGESEKDRSSVQFSALVVNAGPVMPEDVARVLGGPARDFAPPSQRPLEMGTASEITHSFTGQGRDTNGARVPHRLAVVVPYDSTQTKRGLQVQALVDGYRESRPGTMPLLLVLRYRP